MTTERVYTDDMTTTQNNQNFIPANVWDTITFEEKMKNAERHNQSTVGTSPCHICNRIISDKAYENSWFVHQRNDGALVSNDVTNFDDPYQSQGWFPVGAACAKKIPTNFRKKFFQGGE